MPEIDKDLFHLLSLVLLGLTVLLLLGVWSALSGIRKALRDQADVTERLTAGTGGAVASTSEAVPAAEVDEPAVAPEPQPVTSADIDADDDGPEIAESASAPAPEWSGATSAPGTSSDEIIPAPEDEPVTGPTPGGPEAAETFSWDKEEDRLASSYTPSATSEPVDDPFATSGPTSGLSDPPAAAEPKPFTSEPVASEPVTSDPAPSVVDDDPFIRDEPVARPGEAIPEDEPFERNGRWFFKRGDEFLAYDEATGQWVDADPSEAGLSSGGPASPPSPAPATFGGAAAEEDTSRFTSDAGPDPVDDEPLADEPAAQTTEQPSAGGGFWKCPSCGAVNGASASTCRMCFSARP